jgi:hypothetical protein
MRIFESAAAVSAFALATGSVAAFDCGPLASDPKLEILWSAKAECTFQANYSTETTRITQYTYDFDSHLTPVLPSFVHGR